MATIFAQSALLRSGWANNVSLEIRAGIISSVITDSTNQTADVCVDVLLPALANVHSHTFQRAMAGMSEFRANDRDDFWTWREVMYSLVDRLNPEQVEAIAALAFMEMQEAGFASVGEFHYLHHQQGGQAYDNPIELSLRIFAAAEITGIGLTHLPVLYSFGGVKKTALQSGQLRFSNTLDQFNILVDKTRDALKALPSDANIGVAPHSLRATSPEDLAELLASHTNGPIHIHVAEQQKEVHEITEWLGERPVAWLLANLDIDQRWCLIHATHMTRGETVALANSGAVAGLCPITEANLGDGPFNGPLYFENDGAFGIGSDSNIRISLSEELRTLEYSQRLRGGQRNILTRSGSSVGETLFLGAAKGGAKALGRDCGKIATGALADLMAIDRLHPTFCGLNEHQLLDGLVFAAGDHVVTDLWSAGRHMVQNKRHIARQTIEKSYRTAISQLRSDL